MGKRRYELIESEWDRTAEMLPKEHPTDGNRGCTTKYDNLSVMNGRLWIARTG